MPRYFENSCDASEYWKAQEWQFNMTAKTIKAKHASVNVWESCEKIWNIERLEWRIICISALLDII